MGFMDKIKELFRGREQQATQGIDKAADAVKEKVPDQHDDKVDAVAEKAKDVVEKLSDDSTPSEPTASSEPSTPSEPSAPSTPSEPSTPGEPTS